jgi:NADH:ubiquinone oxidoreductase subunit K
MDSTQSRWGLVSVASTVSLGLIAIAIALYAVYATVHGGCVMLVFIYVLAAAGLIIGLSVVILGIFFLRHQTAPLSDVVVRGIVKGASGDLQETYKDAPDGDTLKETDKLGIKIGSKIVAPLIAEKKPIERKGRNPTKKGSKINTKRRTRRTRQ